MTYADHQKSPEFRRVLCPANFIYPCCPFPELFNHMGRFWWNSLLVFVMIPRSLYAFRRSGLASLLPKPWQAIVHHKAVAAVQRTIASSNARMSSTPTSNESVIKMIAPDNADDYDEADFQHLDVASDSRAPLSSKPLKSKFRQHVNPLSDVYKVPLTLSSTWLEECFQNPSNPIHIDIGCSRGSWALQYAKMTPTINILGLEIRRQVVQLCLHRKKVWNLRNVHFLSSNANVDLANILSSLKGRGVPVQCVTVQFPDPHFKKKHHKRRVVNAQLVSILAENLSPGALVFVQSDILDVMQDMVDHLKQSLYFAAREDFRDDDLQANPSIFPVQTEREIATINKNLPVYRMLFYRNSLMYST